MDTNLEDLSNSSPEMVAQTLFTNEPKDPCSHQIVADPQDQTADLPYIFEILVTIFMEGFDILVGGLEHVDIDNLTQDHIKALNPWFQSIGFNIYVDIFDQSKNDDDNLKHMYEEYYCKIMIRTKLYENFFIMKNVYKNYHFLLNGPFLEVNKQRTNLDELYAIFLTSDKVFKVSFNFFVPPTPVGGCGME